MDKHAFMRACREGGGSIEGALRELDRSLYAVLYRECRRAVRDAAAAQDLVQETFIKVWRRCATFRGDSDLLPWIRGILRHSILDRMKRPDREVAMERDGELEPEVRRSVAHGPTAGPLAEEELRRSEREACFARCWRRFERAAPEHATVMAWIVDDGLDNKQIGEILGRTPGATREFISQCRKRARAHLAEWYALVAAPGGRA